MAKRSGAKRASKKNQPRSGSKKNQPAAGVGHNIEAVDDDIRRAEFVRCVVQMEEAKDVTAEAKSAEKTLYDVFKEKGLSKKDIDYAIRLRKGDDAETVERVRREQLLARWINHPVGTQAELFAGVIDRTPSVDRAFAEGRLHGLEGKGPLSPPYAPSTEQYRSYCEGWHAAQSTLTSLFKKQEEDAAPAAEAATSDAFDDAIEDAANESDDDMIPHAESGEVIPRSEWNRRNQENIAQGDAMAKATA